MIIGVDIGGTKTLIASFSSSGEIEKEVRFDTPKDYDEFIEILSNKAADFTTQPPSLICAGVPGLLDRKSGVVHSLGNLPWQEKHIRTDISRCFGHAKTIIENDSKLAGLAEVRKLSPVPHRALYLTISTGIGGALVINGNLSHEAINMELGKAPLEFKGQLTDWEDFAGGRAFVKAYGTTGDETDDPATWQAYAQDRLGPGVAVACAYLQIDTIVFGGGLGHHSNQFSGYLAPYLDERLHSIVEKPVQLRAATYGKNAVIYGCYEHAKDHIA